MPLINKQPNAILKFCSIGLVQSWWQYGVKYGDPKLDITYTKYMWVDLSSLSQFFFAYIANYLESLWFFADDKAVVLPISTTLKQIDSAILKPTLFCLKNLVVWNTYAIKRAY